MDLGDEHNRGVRGQQASTGLPAHEPDRTDPRPGDPSIPRIDALQDELMSRHSSDGRPPPRAVRMAEWRWLVILAPVALLAIAGWAVSRQLDAGTILGGLVLVVVLVAAAAPVWGAGLMRGSEEREARREARAQVAARPARKR